MIDRVPLDIARPLGLAAVLMLLVAVVWRMAVSP